MIIAIDGPAGTGKSTIAKMLAEKHDLTFLNSGGFYRTLTMAVLDAGVDYKDEEATRAAMEGEYFKTGDIGYTLGKLVFVTGRKKNLIITENGENIAPEYLEAKINSFEEVEESLVVSKRINNVSIVCAKVYMGEDGKQKEQMFREDLKALNESLPSYMRIDDYDIMTEAFRKNSSKKIIRKLYT